MADPVKGFRSVKISELAQVDFELAVKLEAIDADPKKGNQNGFADFDEVRQLSPADRGAYVDAIGRISAPAPKPKKEEPSLLDRAGKAISDADWLTVSATGGAVADAAEAIGGKTAGTVVRDLANAVSNWKFWNG